MVNYPHEPTDKQIERWYNKMTPKQKAQLDKEVEDFKQSLKPVYPKNKNGEVANVIQFKPK